MKRPELPDERETIGSDWPASRRWRRSLLMPLYRLADSGLPGLCPLETHVLICGFPRSGTTLLLAMLEDAFPDSKHFGREISGWRAATYSWRNHSMLISKVPQDIFKLHQVIRFYRGRRAKLKPIIMVRDPRDVLTSHHVSHDRPYFQDLHEWREYHRYVMYHLNRPAREGETAPMLLRYEDLVADVEATQKRVEAFIGRKGERSFADFYKRDRKDFDSRPLNGVRAVEKNLVGRWARDEHRERMREVLRVMPEFPQMLIELGYETDDDWLAAWDAQGLEYHV